MTQDLHGLINAVRDFTIQIAACLALDDVEGDRPSFFLAMFDNTGIFYLLVAFLLFFLVYTCFCTV